MDQKMLKQILDYDPKTGNFLWKIKPRAKVLPRKEAGYSSGHGYWRIGIKGRYWYAHRLAFLWMTGTIPKEIDHINRDRSDNRWNNLRGSNRTMNLANVSGRKGIRRRYGRWYARHRRVGHIGVFDTEEEARNAYKAIVVQMCGFDPDDH